MFLIQDNLRSYDTFDLGSNLRIQAQSYGSGLTLPFPEDVSVEYEDGFLEHISILLLILYDQ